MQQATILVTTLLAIGLMMAPAAAAHHADDESDVNVQGEYYVTVDEEDGITLWEETNGHDGLQTSQTSYPAGDDGCLGDDRERGGVCYAPSDDEIEF